MEVHPEWHLAPKVLTEYLRHEHNCLRLSVLPYPDLTLIRRQLLLLVRLAYR